MKLLKKTFHPSIINKTEYSSFIRKSTRAICLDGEEILLVYTGRYDDYALPGGGVDENEELIASLKRELVEETGANNISNIKEFGIYEEHRPWYKDDFDIQHMISYCYTCTVDKKLLDTSYEDYEIKNKMKPLWININDAIKHNENTILQNTNAGLSIERELYLLRLIKKELL